MKKSEIHYHLHIGPGGKNCTCCFPAPGKRKAQFRIAKRKNKKLALTIEWNEFNALEKE